MFQTNKDILNKLVKNCKFIFNDWSVQTVEIIFILGYWN